MYIPRNIESEVRKGLASNPVTAITGPRQCGKSTLVRNLIRDRQDVIYLDLERPSDFRKLDEPEWFFTSQKDKLICIDEIQRKPDLFPLIRSLTDEWGQNGKFLVLGSASRDLLKQSSESLAGRITYIRLTPFLWDEIRSESSLEDYMVKGGFPRSLLADFSRAERWREDFITTFLERDILQWARVSPLTMHRLWQMIAHHNGQTINHSSFGSSLGVSNSTVRNYIELLEGTFMLRSVQPYYSNTGKRLVKSPKVYISDTGILASLLGLYDFAAISGHPVFGTLWETLVLATITGQSPYADVSFYRSTHGAEMDFVIEHKGIKVAVECKASVSPSLTRGNWSAIQDIQADHVFIVSPVNQGWDLKEGIKIVALEQFELFLRELV